MKLSGLLLCVVFLAGCGASNFGEVAIKLPSARVETRDAPSAKELQAPTVVVVLGTGTPLPDANRAGPGIAVVHKGESYLFDTGAGTIRNAARARYRYDIPSLYPTQVCCAFISHMHSDHTLDLPELAYTMWWRRREGLKIWGPTGIDEMATGMAAMMMPDTRTRSSGRQPLPNETGNQLTVTEVNEGVLIEKDGIRISAFPVNHGEIRPAYGFKIETEDKSIVISGDTAYSERLIEEARGVDLLFHEVISDAGLKRSSPFWQKYHKGAHTTSIDLGRIASKSQPGTLVLYHGLFYGTEEESVVDEVRRVYDGNVVLANDLDLF